MEEVEGHGEAAEGAGEEEEGPLEVEGGGEGGCGDPGAEGFHEAHLEVLGEGDEGEGEEEEDGPFVVGEEEVEEDGPAGHEGFLVLVRDDGGFGGGDEGMGSKHFWLYLFRSFFFFIFFLYRVIRPPLLKQPPLHHFPNLTPTHHHIQIRADYLRMSHKYPCFVLKLSAYDSIDDFPLHISVNC